MGHYVRTRQSLVGVYSTPVPLLIELAKRAIIFVKNAPQNYKNINTRDGAHGHRNIFTLANTIKLSIPSQ